MSSPLGGGGQTFVLPANGNPVILTENAVRGATLFLINTSDDTTVYIADRSSVSAASGVPLEAGTALPWVAGGEVWAAVAPGTTVAVSVVITSAIAAWDPAPAVIGAVVAAELLAQGVPFVLRETPVFNFVTIAAGDAVNFDSSQFGSFIVYAVPVFPDATVPLLDVFQFDPDGNLTDQEIHNLEASPARYAVNGTQAIIQNLTAKPMQVSVLGSNRALPVRLDARMLNATGDTWALHSAFVAGTTYPLTQTQSLVRLQGPVYLDFHINDPACKGVLTINFNGVSGGQAFELASDGELVNSGGGKAVLKMAAVLACQWTLSFVCTVSSTAGSPSVVANLTPASL